MRGSSILFLSVRDRKGRKLTFRDSLALLPFSLSKLTEAFGVEHKKQTFDYDKIEKVTKDLLLYLESDCRGLYEVIEKFYSWELIKRAGGSYTLASQALRVFRTYMDREIPSLSPRLDSILRQGYYGGRTEIYRPIFERGTLNSYDVNSLFPFQMKEHEFPTAFDFATSKYYENRLGFYQCEVDAKESYLPCLGILFDKKYIFPNGKFKGLFTTAEINYARTCGVRIRTRVGYLFKSGGKLFSSFIQDLYRIKEESREKAVDRTIAKLLLNSCYGRFGMRTERESLCIDDGKTSGLQHYMDLEIGGQLIPLMKQAVQIPTFSNVAISAYVTSYARIHMHRLMRPIESTIYYTDTDSIYTTSELPVGTGIGELKKESTCSSAVFLLPKTYATSNVIHMKGFESRKVKDFSLDDFKTAFEGECQALKITTEPRFASLKTALKDKKIVTLTKAGTKEIRATYDKRIIFKKDGSWDSKPRMIGD